MAKIIRLKKKAYVVTATDISALVGYVNGVKGACAAKQAIEYLESQMPNRDWPAIVDAAVTQAKIIRSDRRLFTLSAWQSYQRRKSVKKGLISVAISISLFMVSHANPYVTNVVARQRMPWNGLVDVSYEIVGSTNGIENLYWQLKVTDTTNGKAYFASTFERSFNWDPGRHTLVWNASADSASRSNDIVLSLILHKFANYIVIDASEGSEAEKYPVSELNDIPEGGWTDEYKSTKIILRLCRPGRDPLERYSLLNPFYVGVFEVTQKQWHLVMGRDAIDNGGYNYGAGDAYPVYHVSYNSIRGNGSISDWPKPCPVAKESFIDKLRSKTGIAEIDLPTIAQWQYACRAESVKRYNIGDTTEELSRAGWWLDNDAHLHPVGEKEGNAWGLYDQHGNVAEWCLDSSGVNLVGANPIGYGSGTTRALCGGGFYYEAGDVTSESLYWRDLLSGSDCGGFRLCTTLQIHCDVDR